MPEKTDLTIAVGQFVLIMGIIAPIQMKTRSPLPLRREGIMPKHHKLLVLALVFPLIFAVSSGAQEKLYQVGTINLEATTVAAGLGVSWGKGWLSFQGKDYPIKVEGLNIAAVGISKVNAIGDVYNLTKPADLEGTYMAGGAGIALAGGVKGLLARNQKGVVIDLVASQKGVSLNLGGEGFTIKMK
jgi:hypothetical protein